MDINHIMDMAVKAGKSAAEIIQSATNRPKSTDFKSLTDLVTQTDRDSDRLICQLINDTFPDHGILAEESGIFQPESDIQWIIDPLDGTTNFVHNYPAFAVSIGVHIRHIPMVACIVELPANLIYTAVKGRGAFCDDLPITVSDVNKLEKSLLVTGFGYHHNALWKKNMDLFSRLTDLTQGVRRLGAAAVDLCHVACGKVDGFWEFELHPWDTAAGILLVEEAGGIVTKMDGSPYSIFDNELLASNALLHEEMNTALNF